MGGRVLALLILPLLLCLQLRIEDGESVASRGTYAADEEVPKKGAHAADEGEEEGHEPVRRGRKATRKLHV